MKAAQVAAAEGMGLVMFSARMRSVRRRLERRGLLRGRQPPEVVTHTDLDRLLPTPGATPRGQRLLYVAQQFDYGDPARGIAYEETAFLHTLLSMGFEVRRFDYQVLLDRYGRRAMNEALVEAAAVWRPDIAFFVLTGDQLDRDAARHAGSFVRGPSINWFSDDQWRFETYSRHWAPVFDWVVTTDERAHERYGALPGARSILSQWAFDPAFFDRLDREVTHDVAFIGQPHGRRREIVAELRDAGIEVVTRGTGWPEGRASFAEMRELMASSRVTLNLSNSSRGDVYQLKGRDFEVPGAGALLLTQEHPALARYFEPGAEVATYRDEADILPQVRGLLADDALRARIADGGYRRAHADHTYRHRFEAIFSEIGFD